ncbi:prefoldin subunit 6 [Syncephalastrum racemosum]|uniref:Prefoldin subunit 6 n=1 Tax=Syncephalastrum racemosum TaxID=13706 RepID=A0A1X2HB51_SYNRA|nr:prefoldin subunit 6 [Syncephalastrum racemosum]
MSSLEAKLEAESRQFQQLQTDLAKAVEARQRLDSQQQENELVNKEFEHLEDDANIYKLIGPVLVKQEKAEASTNVKNRLELINKEIERVEKQLEELSKKAEEKKGVIAQLQMEYQKARTQ